MAGFHQLLLAVAADVELEVAAPLVWAIIQFARPAAQTVFAREGHNYIYNLKCSLIAIFLRFPNRHLPKESFKDVIKVTIPQVKGWRVIASYCSGSGKRSRIIFRDTAHCY